MDRIQKLNEALRDIDSKIANKQSHFLDDAGLTKMKQERRIVEAQLKEISNEA